MQGSLMETTYKGHAICIYLPPAYRQKASAFPVTYVQDKGYLFLESLDELENRFRRKTLREMIFVGIAPNRRNDEYTPWQTKARVEQERDCAGQGAVYLNYLANDLKPYIDQTYCTLKAPENTGITGASFGGLISMYAAYLHPGSFGRIASISGSFWYDRFIEFMRSNELAVTGRRIYMDVGTKEGIFKKGLKQNMVGKNEEAYAVLLEKGFSPEDCCFSKIEGAVHGHDVFVSRFPEILEWLFPVEKQETGI
ncbi:hypothetical protein P22_0802 [Propionispora sp. 2/2-37]|uniref:alpha/beta hydrolase n=1 Tax=Propionispora sp. 2/2-37 TaxID=1677858 RepID=UPI0006BB6FB8|nr:alpha/beta hydrolase-fold protein [Propionispora sp. 2/2-37]CUH94736.1 hypothetical protein P22_0802 [Propionispora sp. 2/2-37]